MLTQVVGHVDGVEIGVYETRELRIVNGVVGGTAELLFVEHTDHTARCVCSLACKARANTQATYKTHIPVAV
jgi:hypothetical protein